MSISLITNHFSQHDPHIHALLLKMGLKPLHEQSTPEKYFHHLTREIAGQQLSVKVADVIYKRFEALFDYHPITPEMVLEVEDQSLRDIGLSWNKVKYIKDLALKTRNNKLAFNDFPTMSEEEIITELTKVKGIGRWTAEMFLIFNLGRQDVFSYGDLGLRRAIENIYGFEKNAPVTFFEPIVEKWKPYRSYASLALWHSLDNVPA
jgi:DNA-3-methyladenine glycosylase II